MIPEKIHPSYGLFYSGIHPNPVQSQHLFPGSFSTYRTSKFFEWIGVLLKLLWMDTFCLTSELADP